MARYPQQTVVSAQNIALGQAGSIFVDGVAAISSLNGVFIAIQFLEDTVFDSASTGLVPESTNLYLSSDGASSDISANGSATNGQTFPQGMTIFGRWTGFELASGAVVAYIGG